jgi:hypothetical protein
MERDVIRMVMAMPKLSIVIRSHRPLQDKAHCSISAVHH